MQRGLNETHYSKQTVKSNQLSSIEHQYYECIRYYIIEAETTVLGPWRERNQGCVLSAAAGSGWGWACAGVSAFLMDLGHVRRQPLPLDARAAPWTATATLVACVRTAR